jgi:hypothetical protein
MDSMEIESDCDPHLDPLTGVITADRQTLLIPHLRPREQPICCVCCYDDHSIQSALRRFIPMASHSKIRLTRTHVLSLLILAAGGSHAAIAQAPAGDWVGTLDAGGSKLRLVLHIKPGTDGKLVSSIEGLDQGATSISGGAVTLNGKDLSTEFPAVHGTYHATLSADGKTLAGTWTQGSPTPLTLTLQPPAANLKPTRIDGDWAGTISAGGQTLRYLVHVHAAPATNQPGIPVAITFDSLDRGALGLGGDKGKLDGKSFSFDLPAVHGHYTGTLSDDGNTIHGTWDQGQPLPLDLVRKAAS